MRDQTTANLAVLSSLPVDSGAEEVDPSEVMARWEKDKAHGELLLTYFDGEVKFVTEARKRKTKAKRRT